MGLTGVPHYGILEREFRKYAVRIMQIQGRHLLKEFGKKYPYARKPLERWVTIVEKAIWKTPKDVKAIFNDVSFVKTTTIFNIGGNKYRLLSHVLYQKQMVVTYSILTDEEYDRVTVV
jgi:mRNA interferase HigB